MTQQPRTVKLDSLDDPITTPRKGIFTTRAPNPTTSVIPAAPAVQSKRVESRTLEDLSAHVKPGQKALVCIDIDNTLLARTVVGNLKTGKQIKTAINPDTTGIIQRLRQSAPDAKIVILSAGDIESTREKLRLVGLSERELDAVIVVDIVNGPFEVKSAGIYEYLAATGFDPQHICLIDDEENVHDEIKETCEVLQKPLTSLVFNGHEECTLRVQYQNQVNIFGYKYSFEQFKLDKLKEQGKSAGDYWRDNE